MSRMLLISVRLHDGRYHGAGDEPPAPARMFQALVAGAGLSGPPTTDEIEALQWLECLDPPVIGAPRMWPGQSVTNYVPNNDLDAVDGDHRRVGAVRTPKVIKPRLFDPKIPLLFGWSFDPTDDAKPLAEAIHGLADRVYQFGCGADFAWAWAEELEENKFESRLTEYTGVIYRPTANRGKSVACPQRGSMRSLQDRHAKGGKRFRSVGDGKALKYQLTQAPKPRFAQIAYDSPAALRVFDLRSSVNDADFAPCPLDRASPLISSLRDAAADRLRTAMPHRNAEIERSLIGRKPDGSNGIVSSARVRIIPLPSIGHRHADQAIRRVLVEVPGTCPLRSHDVFWGFSGLELRAVVDGAESRVTVTQSADESMLAHYGVDGQGSRTWRTVTPIVLPEQARRRRIDPVRARSEAKDGLERSGEQARAARAIMEAIRHAGVCGDTESIQVQREPLEANGCRVEAFAPGTRFQKERLWHVELKLSDSIKGPLVIGDGRFLGLGVMAPIQRPQGIFAFRVGLGQFTADDSTEVARALRRAVMARVQTVIGHRERLDSFFSGHEANGAVSEGSHLIYSIDPIGHRLLIVAPHLGNRQSPTRANEECLATLETAMAGFRELRAGVNGLLMLQPIEFDFDRDPFTAPSRVWDSATSYQVTRHAKLDNAEAALSADLELECRRRGLPAPHVAVQAVHGRRGLGLLGRARLTFGVAVAGPIILGRSRHLGGGLFCNAATNRR